MTRRWTLGLCCSGCKWTQGLCYSLLLHSACPRRNDRERPWRSDPWHCISGVYCPLRGFQPEITSTIILLLSYYSLWIWPPIRPQRQYIQARCIYLIWKHRTVSWLKKAYLWVSMSARCAQGYDKYRLKPPYALPGCGRQCPDLSLTDHWHSRLREPFFQSTILLEQVSFTLG